VVSSVSDAEIAANLDSKPAPKKKS
jgi:hypothetical protein